MSLSINSFIRRVGHILLFFVTFHILWLLFYLISRYPILELAKNDLYYRLFLVNSIGFVAFYLTAFWLFPKFIISRRFPWLIAITLVMIILLGLLQYWVQDWGYSFSKATPTVLPPVAKGKGFVMAPIRVQQTIGADIRAIFNILIYMLFGAGYAYMQDWFIKDRQARILEKEKIQAELNLLRYQLNPHFLFNTINDIYYLALIKSDKTANALLELSSLLRYVLDGKDPEVSLDREIDHLKQFIKLHSFRFPNEEIIQKIDTDDSVSSVYIAPLMLSTFIENAFKHGEPGTPEKPVTVQLEVKNGTLNYEVTNPLNPNISKDFSSGIGLPNLERRLTLLYPDRHQLSYREENGRYIAQLQIDLTNDKKYNY